MAIVARMMKVPSAEMEEFTSIYGEYLDKVGEFSVSFDGSTLFSVAEECYLILKKMYQ